MSGGNGLAGRRTARLTAGDRACFLASAKAVSAATGVDAHELVSGCFSGHFKPRHKRLAHALTAYLAVTLFDVRQARVARAMGLHRSNAVRACRRIEDMRDDAAFDAFVGRIEVAALL